MFHRSILLITLVAIAATASSCSAPPSVRGGYTGEEKTVAGLSADMASGAVTSEGLVKLYLHRIETIDRAGPKIGSVLRINPNALEDARRLDAERAEGELRGVLHGIPVLLKDNIESADPMPTV